MAENNRVEQQDERIPPIVPPPQNQAVQPRLRDIQRPVIAVNPSCIQLSDAARNYELKSFHMNLLPTFNGLGSEDALGFMRELYSTSLVDTAAGGYTESSQPSYEEANYMGSNTGRQPPRNDPYSHTYNPGWRNHPNFSWRDQGNARPMGPPGFQQQGPSGFQHQQYRPF
nr:Integrase, catalytic core [Ipomoea batatas]